MIIKFREIVENYTEWLEEVTSDVRNLHNPQTTIEFKISLMRKIAEDCESMADFLEMDTGNDA